MAKIMLLDDSPVMHRVVKLTFADDPRMEIAVARTAEEAEQALASGHTDLIIAYARFVSDSPVSYFEALSLASPRILLLAEDDENMEPFIQNGFNSILRKPFHSDELRTVVEELMAVEVGPLVKKSKEPRRQPPAPPTPPAPPALSSAPTPPAPPARSSAPTPPAPPARSSAPTPPAPPARSSAPTPPAPPARSGAPTPPAPPARSSAPDTPETFSKRAEASAAWVDSDKTTRAIEEVNLRNENLGSGAQSARKSEPQITLDLSGLRQLAMENTAATSRPQFQFSDSEDSLKSTTVKENFSEVNPEHSEAKSKDFSRRDAKRSIDPVEWDETPMHLENVMVSTRMDNHGARVTSEHQLTREDVETIVEEKVASAVDRAVRLALNATLPELRQAVVNEVSQRAVEQLSGELIELRQTLRNSLSAELKELSSQWLRRETPSLAKDVIREEIRRVIEAV